MRTWISSKFGQILIQTTELSALERWKKSPLTYNGENGVSALYRLFLIGSFSYLQVTMTHIKSLDEFEIRPNLTTDYRVSCP